MEVQVPNRVISTQPCCDILSKNATVILFTTTGAATGARWGTVAGPGTGNLKGALIGGGIGFILGMLTKGAWEKCCAYRNWRKENDRPVKVEDITEEVNEIDKIHENEFINFASSLEKKFGDIVDNIAEAYGLRCPLTHQLPEEPSYLVTKEKNPHVFERSWIERSIKQNGIDPMSGLGGYTLKDIHFDGSSIFKMYTLCENTLNDPLLEKNFHPKEIEGLKAMTNDYGTRAELFLTNELHILNQKKEKKVISNRDWLLENKKLTEMAMGINKK